MHLFHLLLLPRFRFYVPTFATFTFSVFYFSSYSTSHSTCFFYSHSILFDLSQQFLSLHPTHAVYFSYSQHRSVFFFLFIFVFVSPYFMYMFEQTNDMSKQTELMNTPEQWTTRIIALTLGLLLLEKLSTLWLSYCYSSTSSVAFYEWLRWWYFCGLPCICPIIFQRCVDFFFFFLLNISSLNINFLSLSLKEKSCSYCHFLLKLKTYEEEEIVICWFLNLYHD